MLWSSPKGCKEVLLVKNIQTKDIPNTLTYLDIKEIHVLKRDYKSVVINILIEIIRYLLG